MGGNIVVSYADADAEYVGRLVAWLRGQGLDLWFDQDRPLHEERLRVVEDRIDSCTAVVAVRSPAARESYVVGVELEHALRRVRPIFALDLEGDQTIGPGVMRHESVEGGRMPSAEFLVDLLNPAAMATTGNSTTVPDGGEVRVVGGPPSAADCFQRRPLAEQVDRAWTKRESASPTQILAGPGGAGKTQLAASVVRQLMARRAVDDVVWVTSTSTDAVVSRLAEAGRMLAHADGDDPSAHARQLLTWLASTPRRWVVVFDDVTIPSDLDGWWPPGSPNGRVMVTTRQRDDADLLARGQLVDVEVFAESEAYEYLAHRFAHDPRRLVEAAELAQDLGRLPLALTLAATYAATRDITCAQVRQLFGQHTMPQSTVDALAGDCPRSVAMTVSLAVQTANQLRPVELARPLLALLSLLDANGVPAELVTTTPVVAYLAAETGRAVDPDDARDAVECLTRLDLAVTVDGGGEAGSLVQLHALVQRGAREQAPGPTLNAAAIAAADALHRLWDVEPGAASGPTLHANTTALRANAEDRLWGLGAHPLLLRAGRRLGESGQVSAAAHYLADLAERAAARLGPDHPDTLTVRSDLARWRGVAGNAMGAAIALEALLLDRLRIQGPDHPDTLATRHQLAVWRAEAGDISGAGSAYEALLADRLRVLGADHPDTLATREILARWRGEAGDATGAANAYEVLLADRMRVQGPDHADTFATRYNLARWQGEAGDAAGAAHAYEALLTDLVRVQGPDHSQTLTARSSLAYWRGMAGDAGGAAAALEALLADRLRVLGPDDPQTLTTRGNLAWWRGEAADAVGAVAALEALLADRLRLQGPDHPHTLTTRGTLAWWQGEAGDAAGAVVALEALLTDQSRAQGPDHPRTLTVRECLAHWRGQAGDAVGAVAALEALLADQLRVLGPDHPQTLAARRALDLWQGRVSATAAIPEPAKSRQLWWWRRGKK